MGGVSHRLGVGDGIPERRISFLDALPSSHTLLGPWRKTSGKQMDLGLQNAFYLMRKMSYLSRLLHFVDPPPTSFSFGVHRTMAAQKVLVCGESRNRFGQLKQSFL